MTDLKGYLYYGASRRDLIRDEVEPSEELLSLWRDFIAAARQEMVKRSGGFPLGEINLIDLEISGPGWSIKHLRWTSHRRWQPTNLSGEG
jgi:hypothetical protein